MTARSAMLALALLAAACSGGGSVPSAGPAESTDGVQRTNDAEGPLATDDAADDAPATASSAGGLAIEPMADLAFDGEIFEGVLVDGSIVALAATPEPVQVLLSIDPATGEMTTGAPIPADANPILAGLHGTDAGLYASVNFPCGVAPVDPDSLTIGEPIEYPVDDLATFSCSTVHVVLGSRTYGVGGTTIFKVDTATGGVRTTDLAGALPSGYGSAGVLLHYDGILLASFSGGGPDYGAQIDPDSLEPGIVAEIPGVMRAGDNGPVAAFGEFAIDPATLAAEPTQDSGVGAELADFGVPGPDGTVWTAELSFPIDQERELHVRLFDNELTLIAEAIQGIPTPDGQSADAQRLSLVPAGEQLLVVASTTSFDPEADGASTSVNQLFRISRE